MTLLGKSFPVDRRSQRLVAPEGYILEKSAKKFKMPDNFGNVESAKIIVRHEVKVRFNLLPTIAGKIIGDGALQAFTLDFCLFVVGFLVGEVLRSGMKELPHQRFLPVRPALSACALTVGQRQEHQRVKVFLVPDNVGKFHDRRRIIEIALLRGVGQRHVMVDK